MKRVHRLSSSNKYVYGTALSLGAVFSSGNADAAVVSVTTPTVITGAGTFGSNGVNLVNTATGTSKDSYSISSVFSSNTGFVTNKLSLGTVISGSMAPFYDSSNTLYSVSKADKGAATVTTGSTGTGIYGFSFVTNGQTNYGWANLTIADSGNRENLNSLVATINSYAFTNAGESGILDGLAQIAPVYAVPEADTLAMLAAGLGLVGFSAKRRREQFLSKKSGLLAA